MSLSNPRNELDDLETLNPKSIAAIYDRYFPGIYRFVRYRLGDDQLAEDIASDTFMRLLEAVKNGRTPHTNLRGWLTATASHLIADHLRRAYRQPTQALPDNLHDSAATLAEEVDRRQRDDSVRKALEQLTSDQQNVLALRFGSGYSLEETAIAMQKNINAVKALQFRALAALRRNIEKTL
ncbi:MAG: sigma-70 family RNA polymerase sigma factor [Anaerolineales bacterium]